MVCKVCNKDKSVDLFCKNLSYCKDCDNKRAREYRRGIRGHALQIFNDQRKNCRVRGDVMPLYSKEEFLDFIIENPEYLNLHNLWKKSGYNKKLSPSVDRLDEHKTYSFDNIRICTWEENNIAGWNNRKNGLNNKQSRIVGKVGFNGKLIEEYYSVNEAGRANNIRASHISEAAKGTRKQVGGFMWIFLSDIGHKNRVKYE